MVLFCLHGPFEASLYEISFCRGLVREEKETRLMWVYCATNKHDLFFSLIGWGVGGGGGVLVDLGFVSFRKKRENNSDTHIYKTPSHFSGKRFRGNHYKQKWEMGN